MEPLAHTLTGLALARTRLRRLSPLATPTLLLAANLPDLDVLTYFGGADFALGARRGWTHGILAMAVLPLALAAAMTLWDRGRRRRDPARPPAALSGLVVLAYLGLLSHPALDWLNTYGIRLLMPFDDRWFYGDAVFIVDPWLWMLLGGSLYLGRPRGGRGAAGWGLLGLLTSAAVLFAEPGVPPAARALWVTGLAALVVLRPSWPRLRRSSPTLATLGLAAALVYVTAMVALSRHAETVTRRLLAEDEGERPAELLVGPRPGDPSRWQVVARFPGRYRAGELDLRPSPTLELPVTLLLEGGDQAAIAAALDAPEVQGMVRWARLPYFEVDRREDGTVVFILDARYTYRRTTGFGGVRVFLDGPAPKE